MDQQEQIFWETRALILELRALEQGRWLQKFKEAFENGSSGDDILTGIRFTLKQMVDSGDLNLPLQDRAMQLLEKVTEVLRAQ